MTYDARDPEKAKEHDQKNKDREKKPQNKERKSRERDKERDEEGFSFSKTLEGFIPDVVKRTFVTGLGALIMSEEGVRNMVSDMRLPKEAVGFIIQQADNTKRELLKIVAKEVREVLDTVNFGRELQKILTSITFEVSMQVRFKPNKDGVVPDISGDVNIKKDGDKKEDEKSSKKA